MSCLAFAGPVPNPEPTCATPTGAGGREKPECSLPSQGEGQGAASPQVLAPMACPRSPGTEAPQRPQPWTTSTGSSELQPGCGGQQRGASTSTCSPNISTGTSPPAPGEAAAAGGVGTGDSSLLRAAKRPSVPPQPLSSMFPVAPAPAGVTPGIYRPSLLPAPPGPFVTGNGRCVK